MLAPPGGTNSETYLKLNPLGRVPALEVDGIVIPESEVICEYLEDRFPEPPLRPADLQARARVRFLSRFADLDLQRTIPPLFRHANPATRDAQTLQQGLDELNLRLDQLEGFLSTGPYAVGDQFTLADCTLVPLVLFVLRLMPLIGGKNPADGRPKLGGWLEQTRKHPAAARVDGEVRAAIREGFRRATR
jgi:glutathione S-transferase